MTITINARIQWEIDEKHPDVEYVKGGWRKGAVFTYEDTYHFSEDMWTVEGARKYVENDLRLVAGGGYDTAHIHNVKITMW